MQGLIYCFVALASLAVVGAAYFGFTFTPVEALLTGLVFGSICVIAIERKLRLRAHARFEKAITDLSRLLGADAQAGQILGQRINALTEVDAGKRLEGLEADISVLGTVIRQVAEAVSELESQREQVQPEAKSAAVLELVPGDHEPVPAGIETSGGQAFAMPARTAPDIALGEVEKALDARRLFYHVKPIVTLPQRRVQAYDLVPRLTLDDGTIADSADFLPQAHGGKASDDILRRIEGMAVTEAVSLARRARGAGQPVNLYVPISRATLSDVAAMDMVIMALEASTAPSQPILFAITGAEWQALDGPEKAAVKAIVKKGASFSLTGTNALRLDFAQLAEAGIDSVRIDAQRFIDTPEAVSDFQSADIASHMRRSGIDLIATGIASEQQIISVLEDGVGLAQGPHIAGLGPLRTEAPAHSLPPAKRAMAGADMQPRHAKSS